MIRYLVRRLLLALLLVLAVASMAFVLTRLVPGQDVDEDLAQLSAAQRAERRAERGLDQPLPVQYAAWLAGVARLDFGRSAYYSRPVADLLGERAVNTAILASAALVLATLVGIPLGVYTGTRSSGAAPAIVRGASTLLLSIPPLVGSLLLVLLAARTGWFPVGGMTSGAATSWLTWAADVLHHLPVPALALALPLVATVERLQSQAVAEAAREPFVRASEARGASRATALARHAWPASLGPVLALYGLMIGALFSGSFVVEVVTAWPGLGRLMFDALRSRDVYLVSGTAAAGTACLVAGTLVTDLVHAAIDPRVREQA